MKRNLRLAPLIVLAGLLAACGAAPTPSEVMTPQKTSVAAPATPAADTTTWVQADLSNARTGQSFKVTDFQGKVVLLEAMAVWCTNCLQQQKQVQALHAALGKQDSVVSIGLDVDPNENAATLKAYADKNGFNWTYAVAPTGVSRELGNRYTAQFLNPTSTPMLIVDRTGQVHPLPFGIKSVQMLQDALQPYLK
jgi:cytochrome oxidase Cu insertion factor (SCO1/SenC/PrrC family)